MTTQQYPTGRIGCGPVADAIKEAVRAGKAVAAINGHTVEISREDDQKGDYHLSVRAGGTELGTARWDGRRWLATGPRGERTCATAVRAVCWIAGNNGKGAGQ